MRDQSDTLKPWYYMNKRIEEIATKAQLEHCVSHVRLQEFAELIVRECLDQCYNRGMNDELYAGQLKAATYIEEHFGVEN